jgi:hypothetical protein
MAAALTAAAIVPAEAQRSPAQPVPERVTPLPLQTPGRTETVTSRARPELDPIGIRIDSMVAFPSLEIAPEFNDNVFKTDTGKQSDLIVQITPALLVQSDWGRHFLRGYVDATSGKYIDNADEDFLDATASVDGRFDLMRDTYFSAGFAANKLHEDRGSPDNAAGLEPTDFYVYRPTVGFYNKWNRLSLGVDGEAARYNFIDAKTSTSEINQDDRDRWRYELGGRLGYEIVPQYEAFVRGSYNTIDYDDAADDAGFQRDSDGSKSLPARASISPGSPSATCFSAIAAKPTTMLACRPSAGRPTGERSPGTRPASRRSRASSRAASRKRRSAGRPGRSTANTARRSNTNCCAT